MKVNWLIVLLLVLTCVDANSKEYKIKNYLFDKNGLPMAGPQGVLLNQQGDVIFYHKGVNRKLRSAFNAPRKIAKSEELIGKMTQLLGELPELTSDFTLFQIIYDKESYKSNCEPCDRQVNINKTILDSLSKKGTSVQLHTIHLVKVDSFVKDW